MTPRLCDIGVIEHGRSIVAAGIELVTGSPAYHAFLFVGPKTFVFQGKQYTDEPAVLEGRPGGAGHAPLSFYPDAVWSTGKLHDSAGQPITVTEAQRQVMLNLAAVFVGRKYGWLNCAAIGLTRLFRWHVPKWLKKILASYSHVECAQLVDAIHELAHIHLFLDNRPSGLVSPGDLLSLVQP